MRQTRNPHVVVFAAVVGDVEPPGDPRPAPVWRLHCGYRGLLAGWAPEKHPASLLLLWSVNLPPS